MMTIEKRADPEGGALKPVPPQETGRTLVFLGGFVLFCSLIAFWWMGRDIRGGGVMMQALFALLVAGGLGLMIAGYSKKKG